MQRAIVSGTSNISFLISEDNEKLVISLCYLIKNDNYENHSYLHINYPK